MKCESEYATSNIGFTCNIEEYQKLMQNAYKDEYKNLQKRCKKEKALLAKTITKSFVNIGEQIDTKTAEKLAEIEATKINGFYIHYNFLTALKIGTGFLVVAFVLLKNSGVI